MHEIMITKYIHIQTSTNIILCSELRVFCAVKVNSMLLLYSNAHKNKFLT